MSLLLDALRRASQAKDGTAAAEPGETLPERSRERARADERDDAAQRGEHTAAEPSATDAGAASETEPVAEVDLEPVDPRQARIPWPAQRNDRSVAQAVFSERRSPWLSVRTVGLAVLAIAVTGAALAAGTWWYYQATQRAVSDQLAGYDPGDAPDIDETGPASATGAGGEGAAAADEATASEAAAGEAGTDAAGTAASEAAADAEPGAAATDPSATGAGDAPEMEPGSAEADDGAAADSADAGDDAARATAAQGEQETSTPGTAASGGTSSSPGSGGTSSGGDAGEADGSGSRTRTAEASEAGPEAGSTDAEGGGKEAAAAATGSGDSAAKAAETKAAPTRRAAPMVRRSEASPVAEALDTGYRALRAGRLDEADRAYARARRLAPDNRDALLGAAAVAQRRGERERAIRLYRRVLDDHPRDPYARAALASLQPGRDGRRSETELKMLLRDSPDSPALRFALGNLYAREQRWADAQEAYFEAFRNAPQNPEYAYNLAVALDHIGQRAAARNYYRRALELLEPGDEAAIPRAAVRRRLAELGGG